MREQEIDPRRMAQNLMHEYHNRCLPRAEVIQVARVGSVVVYDMGVTPEDVGAMLIPESVGRRPRNVGR